MSFYLPSIQKFRAALPTLLGVVLLLGLFLSPSEREGMNWLIITLFLLALFLALGKRRHELVLLGKEAKGHRKILEEYSTEMFDQMIGFTSGALIMSYSLYTSLADNSYMMLTIPFAIHGLFRYLFLVHAKNFGGETEMIFNINCFNPKNPGQK